MKRLYIVGHPVGHSKSPAMYNAVYERMGLAWRYDFADIPEASRARDFLEAREYLSVNVTTPYKQLAFDAATAKAASVKLSGGANVLVARGEALVGYNTDGTGCVTSLARAGASFEGASVVVCGTGPTSLAILHAAAVAGAGDVCLLSRDKDHAKSVLSSYVERFGELAFSAIDLPASGTGRSFRAVYDETRFRFGSYKTSLSTIEAADIVIDATPLGMCEGDPAPFDTAVLHDGQWVLDVVYGHGVTSMLAAARAAGARALDGSGMLVAQAVATARILFDIEEVSASLDDEELFEIMARAAGFEC